jgi:hypothetical protein
VVTGTKNSWQIDLRSCQDPEALKKTEIDTGKTEGERREA